MQPRQQCRDAEHRINSGRRAKGDIVWIVGGQASVAHGTHQAEPTEDLHCARKIFARYLVACDGAQATG
jgi:hypothetical protein